MLKARLRNVSCDRKRQYTVYLDSGQSYRFKNKRKAQDFIRHVSKEMNTCIYFLNEEFLELSKYYRHYFLNSDHHLKQKLQASIDHIDQNINQLLRFSTSPTLVRTDNANYHIMSSIKGSFFELLKAYKLLIDLSKKCFDPYTRQKIQLRYRIIELYMIDFKQFEEKTLIIPSEIQTEDLINEDIIYKITG